MAWPVTTSSGPNSPDTGASDSTVGAVAWTTPANVTASDNTRTTAVLNNQQSEYLKATDFDFTIPTNGTIVGVLVEIEKSRTAGTGTLTDTSVRLVRRGSIIGENRSAQGTAWTGTDAYSSYGGNGDMWGCILTPAEVNSFDFGVVFSCTETASASATAGVDHIRITIYYVEGYDAAPQAQEGEVYLYGMPYKLAPSEDGTIGKVQVSLATQFPPKLVTNADYGRDSNPVVSTHSVNDLRGGMGLWRYRDTRDEANRYWTGQNINTLNAYAITLGPLATSISRPDDSARLLALNGISQGNISAMMSTTAGRLYYHDNSAWSALVDTLPLGQVYDTIEFNSLLFYAQGSTGYSYQTNVNAVATDAAAGATNPGAIAFTVWDGRIWAVDNAMRLWASPSGLTTTWTGYATLPIPTSYVKLKIYEDSSGESVIWALTQYGTFLYNADSDKWMKSKLDLPRWPVQGLSDDYQVMGATFRDSLYLRYGKYRLYKLTMAQGSLVVEDVTPGNPDGMPLDYTGYIKNMEATNDLLFISMMKYEDSGDNSYSILAWNGVGYHRLYTNLIDSGALPELGVMKVWSISTAQRLYFHDYNVTDGHIVRWIDLDDLADSPIVSESRAYAASGNVELPYFDADVAEQVKTAMKVRIKLIGASSSETVTVAYRINGSSTASFTTLGSAVTQNDEVSLPFGTNNVGLEFKSIQLRLTLARGATTTNSPKVEYIALDYVRKEEVLRGFTINLDLSQPYRGRTPQQMVDHLWGHMKASLWGTFSYRDDVNTVRSHLVKVLRPEGNENTGHNFSSIYSVSLVEMETE